MYLTVPVILACGVESAILPSLSAAAKNLGYALEFANNCSDALDRSKSGHPTPLAFVVGAPTPDDMGSFREIRRLQPGAAIAVLSPADATSRELSEWNVATIAGPFDQDNLTRVLRKVISGSGARAKAGPSWQKNVEMLNQKISRTDLPVLLQGETGVGKEVLARWLHSNSPRADKPFVKLNCAALPSELVESELFGVVKGAFTGASRSTCGKFEMAQHGTILLDEIGDMDLRLQAKLLQVVEDQEFMRVGGNETIKVDVRIIVATHRNLERAVDEGRFREDLFYRLNVVTIHIPPLRDRVDEILPLAEHFMAKHGTEHTTDLAITPALRSALLEHSWPGNIRELQNAIRKYLVVGDAGQIVGDLRNSRHKETGATRMDARKGLHSVGETHMGGLREVAASQRATETEAILKALAQVNWNRKAAAALLEVDYKALLYRMKKLDIA